MNRAHDSIAVKKILRKFRGREATRWDAPNPAAPPPVVPLYGSGQAGGGDAAGAGAAAPEHLEEFVGLQAHLLGLGTEGAGTTAAEMNELARATETTHAADELRKLVDSAPALVFEDGGVQVPEHAICGLASAQLAAVQQAITDNQPVEEEDEDEPEPEENWQAAPAVGMGISDARIQAAVAGQVEEITLPAVAQVLQAEPSLKNEQREELRVILEWLHQHERWRRDPGHNAAPPQLLRFIFGGPGCGKSYFAQALQRHVRSLVVPCSPTGVAAAALRNGRTLHNVLALNGSKASTNANRMLQARQALTDKRLLLLDELSMVSVEFLTRIDSRLGEILNCAAPFGGLGVIAMGDMLQLPPVSGSRLYKPSPPGALPSLFSRFHVVHFRTQVRAAADPEHMRVLDIVRNLASESPPVSQEVVEYLERRVVTHDDMRRDGSWADATVVVAGNEQRLKYNEMLAKRFAERHSVPVIRWKNPVDLRGRQLSPQAFDILYSRNLELWGFFVQGAPAYVSANISPLKGIANGTLVRLHSLKIADDEDVVSVLAALPGTVVELSRPPEAVLVELVALSDAVRGAWRPSETTVPGKVVVPVTTGNKPRTLWLKNHTLQVNFRTMPFDLGFCVTFHKVQGRTCFKVILDLNVVKSSKRIPIESLYVGMSRVRTGLDLRIMPWRQPNISRTHLLGLRWSPDIVTWYRAVHGLPPAPPAKPAAKRAAAKPSAKPAAKASASKPSAAIVERPPAPPPM